MIEVEILDTDDVSEAETPEDALFCAGVMAREAIKYGHFGYSFDPTIRFSVDGRPVRQVTYKGMLQGRKV